VCVALRGYVVAVCGQLCGTLGGAGGYFWRPFISMAKELGDNLKSNRLPQFLCSKLLGGTLSTSFTPFSLQTTDGVETI